MKSATTNTSAIDHLAIASTKASVRRRAGRLRITMAHATSAALPNGTMTLNSRIRVAGTGLPAS
jgi:hypothetical protein